VRASWWPRHGLYRNDESNTNFDIAASLVGVRLPSSCQEVNLELECLRDDEQRRQILEKHAGLCRMVALRRREGEGLGSHEALRFDEEKSKEYTWTGMQSDHGTDDAHESTWATYHVIRLCWSSGVPRREYMNLDHLNCLESGMVREVEKRIP
jgi:hypothetical protein